MTSSLLIAPLLAVACCLAFVAPVLVKLYRKCRVEEITPEWIENFSAASYHPMEALLNEEDFEFLSHQPGFDLALYRNLRRDRLRIFRQYLNRLVMDFNRLHFAARVLVSHSAEDSSDLITRLIWLKLRFAVALVRTEISYVLCCLGCRTLAARALIAHLEEMNAHLISLSAAQAA